MHYDSELIFLKKVLQKLHLRAAEFSKNEIPNYSIDFGLRHFLNFNDNYARFFFQNFEKISSNTIYKLSDAFKCSYIIFLLPKETDDSVFVIGPYASNEITHEDLLEIAEQFSVNPHQIQEFESYYSNIPIIVDKVPLFTMVNVFAEVLWRADPTFEIVDINEEIIASTMPLTSDESAHKQQDVILKMQNMEMRYAYENELIESVSKGQSNRASLMIQSFSNLAFEQRTPDTLRNMKNYCIICNTLLRKATEKGGVHPIYLDKTSSYFAKKIEAITDLDGGKTIMDEMVHSYCRLVRKHSSKHYSPPIQKILAYIDADLTGDLSLRALSSMQGLSNSYLSALFKKETGQTITDYVNKKRVQRAVQLLSTTKLQIQTISQYCGISDVNYFSKIFKKYTNKTPKEFRKDLQHQIFRH